MGLQLPLSRSDRHDRNDVDELNQHENNWRYFEADLKRQRKFGVYLNWPEPGTSWIHPEDVLLAEQLLPSCRIFCRDDLDREYNVLTYGRYSIRVRPTIWLETVEPAYQLGDHVEIKSDFGRLDPQIAIIREALWNPQRRRVEYQLIRAGRRLPGKFVTDDLQPVAPLGAHLPARQIGRVKRGTL